MGFASAWLAEKELFPEIIHKAPYKDTGIIVVIPSYNEPGIVRVLDSLAICSEPECKVEVIVVVNAPPEATAESLNNNKLTLKNITRWKKENKNCFFRLFAFMADSTIEGWGVGMARKTGMDEALRRFNAVDNPDGVILSLDADCLVEKNYLISVYLELLKRKDRKACSIYFEHPLRGEGFSDGIYSSIILYELHLRYYVQGLVYARFPYPFHTVGSALAVKALPYIKAGGMNRKKAGEDFYFIQKLVSPGGFFNLNTTAVYPSPRTSFRVPFGTGATMEKLSVEKTPELYTYNILAFVELRSLFEMTESFYNSDADGLQRSYLSLPEGIRTFIEEREWITKITEIKNNTCGLKSFIKRFYEWFNMFRIVKYMNSTHKDYFEKKPVAISASELLVRSGSGFRSVTPLDLLMYYRSLERSS